MASIGRQRSRIAALEAAAPPERSHLDLACLTYDELVVLAELPLDYQTKGVLPPDTAAEVERILAKASAHCSATHATELGGRVTP